MSLRPPSIGFVYLTGVVICFFGFFAYVSRPMWWDLKPKRQQSQFEAEYLERILEDAPAEQRRDWLSDALREYANSGDLKSAARILAKAEQLNITVRPDAWAEVAPDLCWMIGGGDDAGWVPAKRRVAIYLRNDSPKPQTIRMYWSSIRDGNAALRGPGEDWRRIELHEGAEKTVERILPASSTQILEAVVTSPSNDEHRGEIGLRLLRVEVTS